MTAVAAAPPPARLGALLVGLALAFSATPAAADYRESYRKGIVEADRQAWSAVAPYMREAIAEQGTEGETVKIYGVRFMRYLPHFFLGVALAQGGSCQEALEQWKESESQGAVQSTPHYRRLLNGRHACRLQLAGKSPPAPPGPDPGSPPQAARDAAAARDRDAADQQARQRAEADRQARDKAAAAEKLARDEDAARNEAARKEAARNEAARNEAARSEAARRQAASAEQAQRQALSQETSRATGASQPGPPPELRAAARALFRADYDEVVRTLGSSRFSERRAKVAATLLLGAARYSLYVQGGAKDERLRRQALDDARACRRLSPALRLDAGFFSPGFREFYRTAG